MPDSRVSPAAPAAISPAERKRRRRTFWGNVYLAVCVAAGAGLLAVAPRLADEQARDSAYGGAVRLFLGAFMLVILLVRGRRGHDTMPSRGVDACGTSGTGRSSGGCGPWSARRPSHSCSFSS